MSTIHVDIPLFLLSLFVQLSVASPPAPVYNPRWGLIQAVNGAMGLMTELKRRNVFRVAVAYTIIAWVLAQVADLAFDNFGTPDWVSKTVLFLLVLGFPLAVFFAWAFEMTPEGVKKESEVDRSQSVTKRTGRKLDFLIIGVLAIAVGWLLVDKLVLQDEAEPAFSESTVADVTDKSVAVLPFVAMSKGDDDEYFADGLTEEILNSLAQLPELLVTARTSAFAFKGQDIAIPEVALKLGVAHVVEGSVRRAGERIRITAQLIRANDGFHLWSETYDRSNEDSFGIQGEIAEKIAAALDVVLDEQRLAKMNSSGLRNPEAFIAYQKGLEVSARAHEMTGLEQPAVLLIANSFFERVIELEPGFSAAHFDHGDYYVHLAIDGEQLGLNADEIAEAIELAKQDFDNAARLAVSEGDRLNATLETTLISGKWRRLPELLAAAFRSQDCINPSWWGGLPTILNPTDESMLFWQRTMACDPLNFFARVNIAQSHSALGEFEAALATAKSAQADVPHRQIVDRLFIAFIGNKQFAEASATSLRYVDDERSSHIDRMVLAAATGDAAQAHQLMQAALAQFGDDAVDISGLAVLGERQRANELAAKWDKRALGFMQLMEYIGTCLCGAPFDLEYTPNFARLIEQADLPWPPPAPIDWPLKDW